MMALKESDQGGAWIGAARRILRPLVKALIARGITAPSLYAILKSLYVEVAERDFRLDDEPVTDSRISVLTGVHRKDVRQLRGRNDVGEPGPGRRITLIATVIGRWLADPETTDAEGRPLPLPRQAEKGPSFDRLVTSISRDIRPRTILDELLRRRLVSLDEGEQRVTLQAEAFLDQDAGDDRLHFFTENLGDHVAAATENVLAEGKPPFFERAVFYNNLSGESLDEIEAKARALGTEALSDLNRLGYSQQSQDAGKKGAHQRFRFGIYFYRVDERPPEED